MCSMKSVKQKNDDNAIYPVIHLNDISYKFQKVNIAYKFQLREEHFDRILLSKMFIDIILVLIIKKLFSVYECVYVYTERQKAKGRIAYENITNIIYLY